MKKVIAIFFVVIMNNAYAQLNPATMIHYRNCKQLSTKEEKIRCLKRSLLAHQRMLQTYNGENKKIIEQKITLIEKQIKNLESIRTVN